MGRFFNLNLPQLSRKNSIVLLAFFWFLGLFLGAAFSAAASNTFIPLMRTAASGRVSIDGLLTAILLPFLLSAFAVLIREPWLLLPISFGKGFLFSCMGFGILAAYGSAGWLIRWLLMFSDCCSLPLLFWYWVIHLPGLRRNTVPVTALVLLAAAAIGSVDYHFISPFLARVLS